MCGARFQRNREFGHTYATLVCMIELVCPVIATLFGVFPASPGWVHSDRRALKFYLKNNCISPPRLIILSNHQLVIAKAKADCETCFGNVLNDFEMLGAKEKRKLCKVSAI